MTAPKLALFDLDGTLVDSRQLIHASMDEAFRVCGLGGCEYDHVRKIVGIELSQAVRMLLPEDYPDEGAAKVTQTFRESFVRLRADGTHLEGLYDGALDLLAHLERDGWLLGVATGKPRRGLDHILDTHDLHGFFVTLHTSCTGPGKPDPRMVLEAMEATKTTPDRVAMIGDSTHDIAMAVNAGVRAKGVTWGFHTAEELSGAGAHEVFDRFEDLRIGLDRFGSGFGVAAE